MAPFRTFITQTKCEPRSAEILHRSLAHHILHWNDKMTCCLTLIFIWVTWKLLWSSVERITLAFNRPASVRKPGEGKKHWATFHIISILYLILRSMTTQLYRLRWKTLLACSLGLTSHLCSLHRRPVSAAGGASLWWARVFNDNTVNHLINFHYACNFVPVLGGGGGVIAHWSAAL